MLECYEARGGREFGGWKLGLPSLISSVFKRGKKVRLFRVRKSVPDNLGIIQGLSESITLPTRINFDPKHYIRQTLLRPGLA